MTTSEGTIIGGYTCPQCGGWVNFDATHNCVPMLPPSTPFAPQVPWLVLTPLLERLVVALEKLSAAAEKSTPPQG
jgi:transglutaminase-like putative cysteine protease